ncbi:MAG: diguanylate cyclase [Clostridia bacterium]|nr:diguanylate cyclase [Clostridia bacterium]
MNEVERFKKSWHVLYDHLENEEHRALLHEMFDTYKSLKSENINLKNNVNNLDDFKNDLMELFDFSPISYVMISKDGSILWYNETLHKWIALEKKSNIIHWIESTSHKNFNCFMEELIVKGVSSSHLNLHGETDKIPVEINGKQLNNHDAYMIAIVNELNQYNTLKKIREMTFIDELTGLYNRRYFENEISKINHEHLLPLSVIVADVNGLKLINDALGHHSGDLLLKRTADIMLSCNSGNDIISRIGGDEFAILLYNTHEEDCQKIMSKYAKECSRIYVEGMHFSVAFGSATLENLDETIDNVFATAEDKMYRSKLIEETSLRGQLIENMISNLFHRCPEEKVHAEQVSQYMVKMGQYFGYDYNKIEMLRLAGLYHDIGKIALKNALFKRHKLYEEEDYIEMKKHPEIGYRILKSHVAYSNIATIILYHHERWDGNGYPRKLSGADIPMASRILAVCDAYEAMTSNRTYTRILSHEEAIHELIEHSGTQFDEAVVKAVITILNAVA